MIGSSRGSASANDAPFIDFLTVMGIRNGYESKWSKMSQNRKKCVQKKAGKTGTEKNSHLWFSFFFGWKKR
jgi:hypothetical protein